MTGAGPLTGTQSGTFSGRTSVARRCQCGANLGAVGSDLVGLASRVERCSVANLGRPRESGV